MEPQEEQTALPPESSLPLVSHQEVPSQKPNRMVQLVSILLLFGILLAIPVTLAIMGQRTRTETKAANECKSPPIPDPADCVGGEWKLVKRVEDGCVTFRCTLP